MTPRERLIDVAVSTDDRDVIEAAIIVYRNELLHTLAGDIRAIGDTFAVMGARDAVDAAFECAAFLDKITDES